MAEDKKVENENKIEEKDLDKAAGGGLFSEFSEKEYEEAGVNVVGAGPMYNEGYMLAATGEKLTVAQADDAVRFFRANHYQVHTIPELEEFRYWYLKRGR